MQVLPKFPRPLGVTAVAVLLTLVGCGNKDPAAGTKPAAPAAAAAGAERAGFGAAQPKVDEIGRASCRERV